MIPQDLKFTKSHEWARLDPDPGIVTVGISAFAVEQLGDIVFIELPEPGTSVTAESSFGVIESVKAAVDLYSPVTGQIVETNQALCEQLDSLAADPYGRAWFVKIKPQDPSQLAGLMSPADYQAFIKTPEAQH